MIVCVDFFFFIEYGLINGCIKLILFDVIELILIDLFFYYCLIVELDLDYFFKNN